MNTQLKAGDAAQMKIIELGWNNSDCGILGWGRSEKALQGRDTEAEIWKSRRSPQDLSENRVP